MYIDNTTITSAVSLNSSAIKSGTVTFDPSPYSLTLINAVIESEHYAIQFNTTGWLVIEGTNTVTSTDTKLVVLMSCRL